MLLKQTAERLKGPLPGPWGIPTPEQLDKIPLLEYRQLQYGPSGS